MLTSSLFSAQTVNNTSDLSTNRITFEISASLITKLEALEHLTMQV